jgi:hydroxymethylbilane synthase
MAAWRIGTRGSPLALAQAEWVAAQWAARGVSCEIRVIHTRGDAVQDRALDQVGGTGLFTSELERALLDGEIDVAVHSLKDVPTRLPEGCALAAVTAREDPRDVLVTRDGRGLDALPADARVGTSSLRRAAIWRAAYPSMAVVPVRGNLGTRLAKLGGPVDALVLAAAGLHRMGQQHLVATYLDPGWMVPAPGQGALGVEVRADDRIARERATWVEDAMVRRATAAERRILDALGGNCQIPVGAYARMVDGAWELSVFVGADQRGGRTAQPRTWSWRGPEVETGIEWILGELQGSGEEVLP